MKLIGILGCVLFLWSTILVTTPSGATVKGKVSNVVVNDTKPPTSHSPMDDDDDEDFIPYQGERVSTFDWMLFKALAKKYPGNVLISPISIKLALVLLYEGAQDQTAQELSTVLQLPVSRSATRDKFSNILRSLKMACPEYSLDIGTRLYIDSNVAMRQRYAAIVKTFYRVDVTHTDLSDTEVLAAQVNEWVKNVTKGHIDRLIEDENSLKDTVMLIVNALFFKGQWRRQFFSEKNTYIGKFYTNPTEGVEVPFMTTIGRFYYSESSELDAKILRLPYDGHKFAMYLVLPNAVDGIDKLTKEINPFTLVRHVWLMQDVSVEVTIPKFKFEFSSHLESFLRELGIRDIFDDTASLTGIAKTKRVSKRLVVSDVLQKTGIEVNENGTSAYVATGIQIGNKFSEQTFHANRPFIFYIEDETTGTILYIGKISNPLQTEGSTADINLSVPSRFGEELPIVTPAPDISPIPNGPERYNFFNIDLLQAINEGTEGNVIMSPASAKLALSILAEGAKGQSRQEIYTALRLPENLQQIRGIAHRTLQPLKSIVNGTEIDVASRLWTKQGLRLMDNYYIILRQYYNGDIQSLDFTNANVAEQTINNWVRVATRNNVRSIIDPGSLTADTTLVLTSALYFKGKWHKAFNKAAGFVECFRVPKIGCRDARFMANTDSYRNGYIPSLDADVVEIPYTDGKTVMLVILPNNERTDPYLQILSKDLSYIPISSLLANLELSEVNLILPKFSIESKLDLKPALERLGIRNIFEMSADFSKITVEGPLHVGNILQNAKIEVDEEGTTAAAVTGISIVPLIGQDSQTFRANHPFIFLIVDLQTNGTLFAGRFIQPDQSNLNAQ